MEKIQQYCNKKYAYIGTIAGGVIGLILFFMTISIENGLTNVESFSGLSGIVGSIKTFCYMYYLDFVLLLMITAIYAVRLLKLNDQSLTTKILLIGNGTTLLFCIISLNGISTIQSIASGDFGSIMGAGNLEGQMNLIGFMILLQVALACYVGFLFYKNKGKEQLDLGTTTSQASESADKVETTTEPKESIVTKLKAYYTTSNGKRNIYIGGAVITVLLIAFIGISIYNNMKRTPINLTENCKVNFEGVSGEGVANINCAPDYDMSDVEISTFVNAITYSVKDNGTLKNGDTIQIEANYSEATADSLKLEPKNTTKKVKVKGLEVAYMKFVEVPKTVSSKFEAATKQRLETELKDDVGGFLSPKSLTLDEIECIASYYEYSSYDISGTAYYIYRTKETKEYTYSTEKEVNYYYVYVKNINSKKDLDLTDESDDIGYNSISAYEDEKTDKKILNSFKNYHDDAEIVKENPSTLTYKDETIKK